MVECKESRVGSHIYEKECRYDDGVIRYFRYEFRDFIEKGIAVHGKKEFAIVDDFKECSGFNNDSVKLLIGNVVLCDDGLQEFITDEPEKEYSSVTELTKYIANYVRQKLGLWREYEYG